MSPYNGALGLLIVILLMITACQNIEEAPLNAIDLLHKEYELDATSDRAIVFLDSLDTYVANNVTNTNELMPYLEKGINISKAQGMLTRTASYLLTLLRVYPDAEQRKTHLLSLGDVMYTLRKRHASSVVFKELLKAYPGDAEVQKRGSFIDSIAVAEDDYISYLLNQIQFSATDREGMRTSSMQYVDAVEALALVSPQDTMVPDHLYTAGEVARSLRTIPKAMSLYDWLIDTYPENPKTANALFTKGFLLDDLYERSDEAKAVYERFIRDYPDHIMAQDAKFLLDNIGKSEEELIQQFEANRKSN